MMIQTTETKPPPKALRQNRSQEIVFVDAAIDNYPLLVAGVAMGAEVVVLGDERDGIEQITQVLRKRREVMGLHIVCRGMAGSLQLGTAVLNLSSLERYVWDLALWSNALALDAALLLYGSEIAKGVRGEELLTSLSSLIEAPIAASTSKTGCAALGGNWDLNYKTGPCEISLVFDAQTLSRYEGLL